MERNIQSTMRYYLPLDVFEEISTNYHGQDATTEYALYHALLPRTLTVMEMKKFDYPIESPDREGYIQSKGRPYLCDPNSRMCCRCYDYFKVDAEGRYRSDTYCMFHPGNMQNGLYDCCMGAINSDGCICLPCHVTSETIWDDVEFKRTGCKRQVKADECFKVYSLDCEMVYTVRGLEVAKVAVVDVRGVPVYQHFVQPDHRVLDYNTRYSGITEQDLRGVTITLADVQMYLMRILNKDTILVGHALHNDLKALRILHDKVVDTQVEFGRGYRRKLKTLALKYLSRTIQDDVHGHDPCEDARTCMELMLFLMKFGSCDALEKHIEEKNSYLSFCRPKGSLLPRLQGDLTDCAQICVGGQLCNQIFCYCDIQM